MRKEISARTHADGACDEPTCQKEKQLASARKEESGQAGRGKRPHGGLRSRENHQRSSAIFEPLPRAHGADVLQVVGENVTDELVQSTAPPEIKDHQSQHN